MFGSKTLKAALTGTTALIGVAMLMAPTPASAAAVAINGNQVATENMAALESLTVGNAGSVATGAFSTGVLVHGVTATSIANHGTIGGSGGSTVGILVNKNGVVDGHLTGGIDNFGTIFGGGFGNAILVASTSSIGTGITNEIGGLINGSGNGIRVQGGSDITGLVSNAGNITVGRTAIEIANGGNISGGIDNTGHIAGGFDGIGVFNTTMTGNITNHAGKTISGGTAGIMAGSDGDISGAIDNFGTITGGGGGILVLSGSDISHVITNETTGTISGVATVAGNSAAGIGVNGANSTISVGIANSGAITGHGANGLSGGTTGGVAGGNGGNGAGINVINSGTIVGITNNTGATISGTAGNGGNGGAFGLLSGNGGNGGNGGLGAGINVDGTGSAISGVFVNHGTISGQGGAGGNGGAAGTSGGTIGNGGAGGNGAGINVSNHGTIAGITNDGTISGAGGAGGTGTSNGAAGAGVGIAVTNHGTITSAINNNVTAPAHVVTATGTISGTGTGILVTGAGSQISGGIDNHGIILGTAQFGINVTAGGTISTVDNAVTVDNQPDALHQVVLAHGQITGNSAGVNVTGVSSDISGGITNAGTITGTAGAGISVGAGGDINGIANNVTLGGVGGVAGQTLATGLITGTTFGVHVASSDTGFPTLVPHISHISGVINNSGTIHGNQTGIGVTTGGDISGNIVNSGTISGNFNGIKVDGGIASGIFTSPAIIASKITGTIDNSGTISGDTGIAVSNGGQITGLITNEVTGHINGSSTGILVTGATSSITGLITNHGHISGGSSSGIGINIAAGGHLGGIVNSGSILGGSSSGTGINVGAGSTVGAITNTGTIAGNTGIKVAATGSITGGGGSSSAAILVNGTNGVIDGGINNSGTIVSGGQAISVTGHGTINGGITNTVTGVIHGTSVTGTGINVSGAGSRINGGINNAGTISGGFANGDGINVGAGAFIRGGIVNTGTIAGGTFGINNAGTIGGSSVSTGIRLTGAGTITGGIFNSGHIVGNRDGIVVQSNATIGSITNAAGGLIQGLSTDGIFVGFGGAADITGGIDNFGTIIGAVNGIHVQTGKITGGITNEAGGIIDPVGGSAILLTNLTGLTPITINGDSVDGSDTNDSHIIGDVFDNNIGNNRSPVTVNDDFVTEGNFTVSSMEVTAGTLTIGGTNNITANSFTADAGSTVKFVLNDNTHFGNISPVNGATTLTGASLAAKVQNNSTLTNGTSLEVVQGDTVNAVVGAPVTGTLVADNSFIWNFAVVDGVTGGGDATDLFLQAILAHPIIATTGNQDVFDVLEGLTGTTNPELAGIIANLNGAGTQQGVSDILEASTPTVDGSDQAASASVDDHTLDLIDDELASLRTGEDNATGMAAGNMAHGFGAWGQAFGSFSNEGRRESIAGYNSNTWGGAVGVDTRNVSDRAVVGLAFSYGRTDATSKNVNTTDTTIDNYQAMLYGDFDLAKDTYLSGMAGYTWGSVNETRHNVGLLVPAVTAHGSYNTSQFSAQAEVGRDYAMQGGATVTPNLLARWSDWNPDSYTETGAGGADLHVDGKTLNTFELGGGVKAGWSFKNRDGSWLKPQVHAGVRYNLEDTRVEDTTSFTGGGGSFLVPGPHQARTDVNLGAGLKLVTTKQWTVTGSYNFDWKSDYTAHSLFLRAGYKF